MTDTPELKAIREKARRRHMRKRMRKMGLNPASQTQQLMWLFHERYSPVHATMAPDTYVRLQQAERAVMATILVRLDVPPGGMMYLTSQPILLP